MLISIALNLLPDQHITAVPHGSQGTESTREVESRLTVPRGLALGLQELIAAATCSPENGETEEGGKQGTSDSFSGGFPRTFQALKSRDTRYLPCPIIVSSAVCPDER